MNTRIGISVIPGSCVAASVHVEPSDFLTNPSLRERDANSVNDLVVGPPECDLDDFLACMRWRSALLGHPDGCSTLRSSGEPGVLDELAQFLLRDFAEATGPHEHRAMTVEVVRCEERRA